MVTLLRFTGAAVLLIGLHVSGTGMASAFESSSTSPEIGLSSTASRVSVLPSEKQEDPPVDQGNPDTRPAGGRCLERSNGDLEGL